MVGPIIQGHTHVDHLITGQVTASHRFAHAFFHRRDIIARDRAADDLVDELESFARRQRLDLQPSIAELTAPAGLLF